MQRKVAAASTRSVLLVGAVGCGVDMDDTEPQVDGPDFEVRYRTRYVDVAPGFTAPVCRGSLLEIDRQVEEVAKQLHIDLPSERITLYWFNPDAPGAAPESIDDWCDAVEAPEPGDATKACYRNGVIYSPGYAIPHELGHAVVMPAWGRAPPLFEEGVANAFHPRSHTFLLPVGDDGYLGRHFSRWLIDEFGAGAFSELFGKTRNTEHIPDLVVEAFGLTFEQLEDDYLADAPAVYPTSGLCDNLPHAEWPSDGSPWSFTETVDCEAPHVSGPTDDAQVEVSVTVDIPDEPDTLWAADPTVYVVRCLDAPVPTRPLLIGDTRHQVDRSGTPLPAGRYRLFYPTRVGADIDLTICRRADPHGSENGKGNGPGKDEPTDLGFCLN